MLAVGGWWQKQDWSGHCKKKKRPLTWEGNVLGSMASGTYTAVRETQEDATSFACLRGQDRTDLDRKKKKPSMEVFSTGQDTK